MSTKPVCPNCKVKDNVKEIQYGLPSGPAEDDAEYVLGGCMVFEGQANWVCTKCDWDDSDFPIGLDLEEE